MNTLSLRISASVFDGHLLIALIALEVYVRWRKEAKNLSDKSRKALHRRVYKDIDADLARKRMEKFFMKRRLVAEGWYRARVHRTTLLSKGSVSFSSFSLDTTKVEEAVVEAWFIAERMRRLSRPQRFLLSFTVRDARLQAESPF